MIDNEIFKNHAFKCRICLRDLTVSTRTVKIDGSIQKQFREFTGITLKELKHYSDKVCSMCEYELKRLTKFRQTISERQTKLYELYPDPPPQVNQVDVKTEDDMVHIPKVELAVKEEELDPPTTVSILPIEEVVIIVSQQPSAAAKPKYINLNSSRSSPKIFTPCCKHKQIIHSILKPKSLNRIADSSTRSAPNTNTMLSSKSKRKPNIQSIAKPKCIDLIDETEANSSSKIPPKVFTSRSKRKQNLQSIATPMTEQCIIIDSDDEKKPPKRKRVVKVESVFVSAKPDNILDEIDFKKEDDDEMQNEFDPELKASTSTRKRSKVLKPKKIKEYREYHCDLCKFSCISHSISLMRAHIFRGHSSNMRRKYRKLICDYCGKSLKEKKSLERHVKKEAEKRHRNFKFICELCGEDFREKTQLTIHKNKRHFPKTFCDFCMKPYSSKQNLVDHMRRIHMNLEKSFLCHLCPKSYVTKTSLTMHLSDHRNRAADKYQCSQCNFKSKGSRMRYHVRVYHQGLRFTCIYKDGCDSIFCTKKDIGKHLMIIHKVSDENEMKAYREQIKKLKPIVISEEERDAFQGRSRNKRKQLTEMRRM